jgi:aspartate aminotransferase
MQLSRRVNALKPSSTLAVGNKAAALAREGVQVLSLAAGEPDFDTPQVIKEAAKKALDAGQTKYMPTAGDAATRKIIAEKLVRENGIPAVTADHVVISAGGKNSIYLVFHALLDPVPPGEAPWEVLLPVPAWVSYAPIAEMAGGKVIELPTTMTPRSRLLVLCSPSNPTAVMYTPDELRALGAVVEKAAKTIAPELAIVSDEIYEKIIYGGKGGAPAVPHFSIGSIPGIAERSVTVNGLSKAFAMTGWRVGYAAGSGEFGLKLAGALSKLQGQMTTCISSFIYPAIRTALTECSADVEKMRCAFGARAELIYGLWQTIPQSPCAKPTGAFYLFPDISAHFGKTTPRGKRLTTAAAFAEALLDEQRVAIVPGEDFGGCGHKHIRISFACGEEQIREGVSRIGAFIKSLT